MPGIRRRFGRARQRAPVGARAARQLHLPAQRRARTTTNPIGNGVDFCYRGIPMHARLGRTSGTSSADGDRGVPAHGKSRPARKPARAQDTALGDAAIRPAVTSIFASRPPIAIRRNFRSRDCLDIRRSPNRNLAFGLGIDACAGCRSPGLRRIAIGKLVGAFDDRACRRPVRSGRARFRGFLHFPVAVR